MLVILLQNLAELNFEKILLQILLVSSRERLKWLQHQIVFDGKYTETFQESQEFLFRDVQLGKEANRCSLIIRLISLSPPEYLSISVNLKTGMFNLRLSIDHPGSRNLSLIEAESKFNDENEFLSKKEVLLYLRQMVKYKRLCVIIIVIMAGIIQPIILIITRLRWNEQQKSAISLDFGTFLCHIGMNHQHIKWANLLSF